MKEPSALKQPSRIDKDIQAIVLTEVRATAPNEGEEADENAEVTLGRFGDAESLRTVVIVEDGTEFSIEVMDEESERVWQIAVWPEPPGSGLEVSYCLAVGSKGQAREALRAMTGAPAFVPNKGKQQIGAARSASYAGRGAQKPGRTQQKQG